MITFFLLRMPSMMTPPTGMNSGQINTPGTPTSMGVAPQPHPNKPLFPSAAAIVSSYICTKIIKSDILMSPILEISLHFRCFTQKVNV